VPFGLLISFACHAAIIGWAMLSMRAVQQLPVEDTPAISAAIITPSEFLRLKQGNEDSKKLETKAKDEPKPDDSKNDTKKPDNAPPPPPPPQEVAAVEPPKPPEPPKVEPPKPPEPPAPDPIAEKMKEPPPPEPTPAPGPTPEEKQALEQKIEEQRKADEAKKKAEEEARKKKLADELKRKKLAEAAKKKAEEAKKFDANKLASLLEKVPDDAEKQKALLDKDPKKKGQQAAGTSQTATETGKEAGTATGKDTVLSAREQDLLLAMIDQQVFKCAQMPGAGGASDIPVVKVTVRLNADGTLNGDPVVLSPQNTPFFEIAARASVNAFRNCAPLHLPPDKYASWKEFDWTFNWPKLLGLQ
jgi:colicin import membrane protein